MKAEDFLKKYEVGKILFPKVLSYAIKDPELAEEIIKDLLSSGKIEEIQYYVCDNCGFDTYDDQECHICGNQEGFNSLIKYKVIKELI